LSKSSVGRVVPRRVTRATSSDEPRGHKASENGGTTVGPGAFLRVRGKE